MSPAKRILLSGVALGIPLLAVVGLISLVFSSHFHWSLFAKAFLSFETRYTLFLTVKYALMALVLAWVFAWILAKMLGNRGKSVLRLFSVLPGMAYAMIVLLILKGFRSETLYSMQSVFYAWVFAGTAYLSSGILEGLRDLDPRSLEAIRSLGANPLQAFYHHEFKGSLSLQASLLLQQFFLYLTSFSLVMILNGGPPNETLEVAIFSSVRLGELDYSKALALASVQGLLLLWIRVLMKWVQERNSLVKMDSEVRLASVWSDSKVGSAWGTRGLAGVLGILSILLGMKTGALLDFVPVIGVSVLLATSVALVIVLHSLCCFALNLKWIPSLGGWISPVLLSLAFWNAFGFSFHPFLNVLLVQTIFFAPGFSRILFPVLNRMRVPEWEAVRVMGAGRVRAWFWVEWPRVRGTLARALGSVVAISLTEVTTVMLFSRGGFDTVSSYSQNLFSRFRVEEAAVGVLILLTLSMLAISETEEVR